MRGMRLSVVEGMVAQTFIFEKISQHRNVFNEIKF